MKSKEAKVNAFDGCFKWPIYTKLMGVFTFYIATAFTITAINLDQLHHTNEPAEEHHDNEVVWKFLELFSTYFQTRIVEPVNYEYDYLSFNEVASFFVKPLAGTNSDDKVLC